MRNVTWAALVCLFACRGVSAQEKPAAGTQRPQHFEKEVTITVEMDYLLYLPKGYGEGDKEWPLVLFLHGAGERGDDLEKVKAHGPPKLIAEGGEFPAVVVSPQARRFGWDPDLLHALLDEVIATHRVDEDRVYVTGLSMGGMGTWALAASRPERFAAIIPICGGGDPRDAGKIKDLPVRIFQGGADPVVRVNTAEAMLKALRDAGAKDVELKIYPDVGHDSWTETYANEAVWDWLFEQKRAPKAEPGEGE